MRKTVVINAVGLTPSLLGPATPRLKAFAEQGVLSTIRSVVPAVTCPVQSTYLTGRWPDTHGIVGNGWYFREECEVRFWRQSNGLVGGHKVWDVARSLDPDFTCASLFWWYNMYSSVDVSVTPRPMYPADGRKIPDIHTRPADLRDRLQSQLGQFPLFEFWGPSTSIRSTRWIADAALQVDREYDPNLALIYLPHLDYGLQRLGPDPAVMAADLEALDAVCGVLLDHWQQRGAAVIILSEYGITPVSRPISLNRVLRRDGLLAIREERGRELLDAGASSAFAVADHQVAHVYVNDRRLVAEVRARLEAVEGVEQVLGDEGKRSLHLGHPRSGELIVIAEPDAWFTYYYWMEDARAPDFSRTVDIHRKPGYDPAELFIDPAIGLPGLKVAWTLLRKKLGQRALLELIALNGDQVRGSHGRPSASDEDGPLLMTSQPDLLSRSRLEPTDVFQLILDHLQVG